MNPNQKLQPNLQPGIPSQQILLQQLQQGQPQSQPQSNTSGSSYPDGLYQENQYYQRNGNSFDLAPGPGFFPPQHFQQNQGQAQGDQFRQNIQQPPNLNPQKFMNQQVNMLQSQQPQQPQLQPAQSQQQSLQVQQPGQALSVPISAGGFQPSVPKVNAINVDDPNTIYWQHQAQLCQLSRSEDIPHFYAKQYAQNSRKNKNPYNEVKTVSLIEATKTIVNALKEQEKQQLAAQTPNTPAALMRNKKMDLEEDEEQRLMARTHGKQLWCHLDMSGQGLLNILPKLFRYDFLESLYLNHNKLTTIPKQIKELRGLRVLDLSHNRITEVPPELGLCYNLRYLYLFDNNIKTLPIEFRNLIELLFLGIEGNPIDLKIANLVAERGPKALINYFRDMEPTYSEPKPRSWLLLTEDGEIIDPVTNPGAYSEDHADKGTSETFTLMSYNTLCQHYATTKLYLYTPSWALDWEHRKNALKEEILGLATDVICLQEVETRTFQEFWMPILHEVGYKGFFFSKTRSKTMGEVESKKVDGCATFFRANKFQFIQKQNFEYNTVCMGSDKYKKTKDLFNRFMNKDHIALIVQLQHIETGEKINLVNTHLHWDPAFNDVKALQVGILLEELLGVIKKFNGTSSQEEVKNSSVIICGDFNSTRSSAVYQLFSTGSVSKHEDLEGKDYGKFTDEGFHHSFKLKSAYDHIAGDFPFTNYTPTFTDVIDYIWYTTSTLQVQGLLGKADEEYMSHHIGIPNAHFASDHIPLVTKFKLRKKGASAKKPDFKPDFKGGSSRKT
uniref:CCR4-Not complex 3'-5'-exoribonuclease subunit Ccr4 n=1 Tax=Candidozyma auris TaxID=498019 RepID=A0A0L0P344_CANAR